MTKICLEISQGYLEIEFNLTIYQLQIEAQNSRIKFSIQKLVLSPNIHKVTERNKKNSRHKSEI